MPDRTCSFETCERSCKSSRHDLCDGHNQQRRAGKNLKRLRIRNNDDARFAQYVRTLPNGCIEFVGCRDSNGYGKFSVKAKPILAHRWYWQRHNGPLDPALHMDHFMYPEKGCIGPSCVLHVRPVTPRENSLRGRAPMTWNPSKTHCPVGHPYDEVNTYLTGGKRKCRACAAEYQRGLRATFRAENPLPPRTHCAGGHAWNDINIGQLSGTNHNYCRACNRDGERARRAARKAAQQT